MRTAHAQRVTIVAVTPACYLSHTLDATHFHSPHLYPPTQVLQLDEGSPSSPIKVAPETFNVRLEELAVIDLAFLAPTQTSRGGGGAGSNAAAAAGSHAAAAAAAAGGGGGGGAVDNPVLALLYEDNKHARHVKTYTLNLRTKVCVCTSLVADGCIGFECCRCVSLCVSL